MGSMPPYWHYVSLGQALNSVRLDHKAHVIAWNAICVWNSTRASTEKGVIIVVRAWKPTVVRVACFVGRHSALIFIFFRFNADGVVPQINRLESIVAELLSMRYKDLSPFPSLLLVVSVPLCFQFEKDHCKLS